MKKGEVHTGPGKVIPKDDASELVTAEEILRAAREEAEEIIEEAKSDGEEIRQKAKEDGFDEGLAKFNEHIKLFEDRVKVLKHDMQKAMLPLVLKATKKIVGNELEVNPDSVVNIVQESIKSVSSAKVVKLYVNKHDLEVLEKEKEQLKAVFESLENFSLEERGDIEPGSCIIETERGILNATLENQYRALERAFENYRKR